MMPLTPYEISPSRNLIERWQLLAPVGGYLLNATQRKRPICKRPVLCELIGTERYAALCAAPMPVKRAIGEGWKLRDEHAPTVLGGRDNGPPIIHARPAIHR